jgi:hypothetical protein
MTEIVYVVGTPARTVRLAGVAMIEKPDGTLLIFKVTDAVWVSPPLTLAIISV